MTEYSPYLMLLLHDFYSGVASPANMSFDDIFGDAEKEEEEAAASAKVVAAVRAEDAAAKARAAKAADELASGNQSPR